METVMTQFTLPYFLFAKRPTDRFWLNSWQRDQVYTGFLHRQTKVAKVSAKSSSWRRKPHSGPTASQLRRLPTTAMLTVGLGGGSCSGKTSIAR